MTARELRRYLVARLNSFNGLPVKTSGQAVNELVMLAGKIEGVSVVVKETKMTTPVDRLERPRRCAAVLLIEANEEGV